MSLEFLCAKVKVIKMQKKKKGFNYKGYFTFIKEEKKKSIWKRKTERSKEKKVQQERK